ncbi:hypothetical protein E4U55_005649 [Claviceps digitariae]|nr:hypothetical protein E4U55_005649 [Claviceps digitariae]
MGRLIKNHWGRLIILTAAAYQVAAAVEGFFWPKFFWDFLTKNLDGAVKPIPILQTLNLLLGLAMLALEWPLKLVAGSTLHRSLEFRLAVLPLTALVSILMYQSTNAAIYYVIGMVVYFWAYSEGEGQAHSKWASRNQHTRDVVEVIDTARDNLDQDKLERQAGIVDEEYASSDSDSSGDGEEQRAEEVPDGSAEHKQGVIDQLRSYKRREKALHRQHRGLMQWKIPRTARWMKHKMGKVEEGVSGFFDHQSKQPGIETEV